MTLIVAQVVPCAVERIPLYHWHPGRRLLAVGDRDGVAWDGAADPAAARTFRRPLDAALLAAASQAAGTTGCYACWSESLDQPAALSLLDGAGPLVVGSAGYGDQQVLQAMLGNAAAWSLHIGPRPGPHAARILREGRHVEVVIGLDGGVMPELPWGSAVAIHLLPLRSGSAGAELAVWEDAARARLPKGVAVYDSQRRHTLCPGCGEELIWRSGARVRLTPSFREGRCVCGQAERGCF